MPLVFPDYESDLFVMPQMCIIIYRHCKLIGSYLKVINNNYVHCSHPTHSIGDQL